jgi:hypothetical protein
MVLRGYPACAIRHLPVRGHIGGAARYAAAIMTDKTQLIGSIFATMTPAVEVRVQ